MLGIVGEYLWRILDQVRGRPRFVVEVASPGAAWTGGPGPARQDLAPPA